ncbi:hypothetical protein GOC07_02050 [Sinorhizobium meliloti]|nr:hypothetical protein [Sinorhizobium meliloti]
MYGNLDFDFWEGSDFRVCDSKTASDVRITVEGTSNWAFLGTQARSVPANKPTLSLAIKQYREGYAATLRGVVLHEFGHVLAPQHIFSHPDFCPLNFAQISADLFWSEELVKHSFGTLESDEVIFYGDLDMASIMSYKLPPSWFMDGKESRCFRDEAATTLSPMDKLAMYWAYPED